MSKFDGSDAELSYGEALVEVAKRCAWPSEDHAREVVRAIQAEHDLLPPEPEPAAEPVDPRDAEIERLKAELAGTPTGDDEPVEATPAKATKAAAKKS